MANLKGTDNNISKTGTMDLADITYLGQMHAYMQQELDTLMERMAGMFLNHVAVTKFDMNPNKDYHFEYHPDREYDNLTITEK